MSYKNRFTTPVKKNKTDKHVSVILYGSDATERMKSYGPKPLYKDIHGNFLLHHQIKAIKSAIVNSEIILVTGFEADKVAKRRPADVRIVENQFYDDTNEVEDIRLALNNCLSTNILLISADMFFTHQALEDMTKQPSLLTSSDKVKYEIGTTVVDNEVTIVGYEIVSPKWCKIAYFENETATMFKNFVLNRNNTKLFLFEAINHILLRYHLSNVSLKNSHSLLSIDASKELQKIS